MAETFQLRGRASEDGSPIRYPGSYKTVDEALQEAEKAMAAPSEIVWIVDDAGNLVLPADQVRLRLQRAKGPSRRP